MFSGLTNQIRGFIANTAAAISERFNLPAGLDKKFRDLQQAHDTHMENSRVAEEFGIAGKNAKDMVDAIFNSSFTLQGNKIKPLRSFSKSATDAFGQPVQFDASCLTKIRSHQGSCLMLTLDSGDVIKIEQEGDKISLKQRNLSSYKNSSEVAINKDKFGLLYASVQAFLKDGKEEKILELLAGRVPTFDSIVTDPADLIANLSPDVQALYWQNDPHRPQNRARAKLGALLNPAT